MNQPRPHDIAIGVIMISALVGMGALFICYLAAWSRWSAAYFRLMGEVQKASPEMCDYLRSFSPYGVKPRFYGSNPDRVLEFVRSDKLNEIPMVFQAKQHYRKAWNTYGSTMGIVFLSAFIGAVIVGVAVSVLDGK